MITTSPGGSCQLDTRRLAEGCEGRLAAPSTISVIIPARNCRDQLERCLDRLAGSEYGEFEVIVVDDASSDSTRAVAESRGIRVVSLSQQGGPAAARNAGAREARGELLVFIDADVQVHRSTLQELVEAMSDPGVAAAFGSYDTFPASRNLISQYRNLLHHFVHQSSSEEASTFWAGCGIVRKTIFLGLGGFDESFARPSIEDIEFGLRLKQAGHRIVLNKNALCTHEKRWTFWTMLTTDFFDRGIPWTLILISRRGFFNDLNLAHSQRASVVVAFLLLAVLAESAFAAPWLWSVLVAYLLLLIAVDSRSRRRCVPPVVRGLYVASLAGTVALAAVKIPVLLAVAAALVGMLILLNWRCYSFFARVRSRTSILGVLPLHVVYFLLCGVAFAWGGLLFCLNPAKYRFVHRA